MRLCYYKPEIRLYFRFAKKRTAQTGPDLRLLCHYLILSELR